jgi:hypothetical protein
MRLDLIYHNVLITFGLDLTLFDSWILMYHIAPFLIILIDSDRQTISFIEITIEAGILLGGKHEACFMLGVAGIEPMPS